DMLAKTVDHALRDGYKHLCITGDMAWEFGDAKNLAKLLEYEFALDLFIRQRPCLHGICQYHQDSLPPGVVLQGVYCHESLYFNERLSCINPYFVPSQPVAEQLSRLAQADVRGMLNRIPLRPTHSS